MIRKLDVIYSLFIFCVFTVCSISCKRTQNENSQDIKVVSEFDLCPRVLDSVATRSLLDQAVNEQFIGETPASYALPIRTDLEYLPYLMIILQNRDKAPYDISPLLDELTDICTSAMDDKALYRYGKRIYSNLCSSEDGQEYGYPQEFSIERPSTYAYSDLPEYKLDSVDTLRVQALIHNDREALHLLEQYYIDKGRPKDLAIYYKVMLCYEGNGDLAEKFYTVLKPYFKYRPEIRTAVREVLLRAALCDHNARAQELCDSLGFSLCDYRLPRLDE